jgi:hypothetical protein
MQSIAGVSEVLKRRRILPLESVSPAPKLWQWQIAPYKKGRLSRHREKRK